MACADSISHEFSVHSLSQAQGLRSSRQLDHIPQLISDLQPPEHNKQNDWLRVRTISGAWRMEMPAHIL